jgi:hypothetical protein
MSLFLRQIVPKKTSFLTTSDVLCQKSSGHKAAKFGRNTISIGTTISQKIIQF